MASSSSSSSDTPSQPLPSPSSAFGKWLQKASLMTGLGSTPEQSRQALLAHQCTTCEKWRDNLVHYSPAVVFMLKHLSLTGNPITTTNISCQPCGGDSANKAGGFDPETGTIVLCAGQFFSKTHMETTMVHEMVHLYDHCKFKVDWSNLRHHACSEIRANSLSGDCRYTRELRRGFVTFSKQHQACVRRRAILSVASNPACPSPEAAEKAVNEVWESCFADTRPFDEIY